MNASDTQLIEQRRSRRAVLALAAGGGAALATLFGRTERAVAADGDPMILGASNSASQGTALGASLGTGFVFGVRNLSSGAAAGGIQAQSSSGGKPAVAGENDASNGIAVFGASNGPGGFGQGSGNGVHGESGSGSGVSGRSSSGAGVSGESESGAGGIFRSTNGVALSVDGVGTATADVEQGSVFQVRNTSSGPGAHALRGLASGGKPAVAGESDASGGTGVVGASSGPGFGEAGHYGDGDGIGVRGDSGSGIGVDGNSSGGLGVHGSSETGIGGLFESFEGIGLGVNGRAAFQTVGAGTIPAGQNSVFVADAFVSATSHISVTLVGNPGSRDLRWVERRVGSGFRVHLSPAPPQARPATAFTYFIVEHQEPPKG